MITVAGRLVLALIFWSAAIAKLRSFSLLTHELRVLFDRAAVAVAAGTISTETALGVACVTYRNGAVLLALIVCFMAAASAVIAYGFLRQHSIECNCWSVRQEGSRYRATPVLALYDAPELVMKNALKLPWYGLRNGAIALLAWVSTERPALFGVHEWPVLAGAVAAVCPAIILVGLVSSLLAQRYYLRREEHPNKHRFAPYLAPLVALSWYEHEGHDDNWIASWQTSKPG